MSVMMSLTVVRGSVLKEPSNTTAHGKLCRLDYHKCDTHLYDIKAKVLSEMFRDVSWHSRAPVSI